MSGSPPAEGGLVDAAAGGEGLEEDDVYISFPYPVASVKGAGWALRAFFKSESWQWVWYGAHVFCAIPEHVYAWVKSNKVAIAHDLGDCGVPRDELHLGSEHVDFKWGTTLSSKALIVVLLSLCKRRKLKQSCKNRAFKLVKQLLSMCWDALGPDLSMRMASTLPFYAASGQRYTVDLALNSAGATSALHAAARWNRTVFLVQCFGFFGFPSFSQAYFSTFCPLSTLFECKQFSTAFTLARKVELVWKQLSSSEWCGYSLQTPLHSASLADVMIFLSWTWSHQSQHSLWHMVGQHWLPELVNACGIALDCFLLAKSQEKPTPIPVQQHKGSRPKALDAVNRMILLERIKKQKLHRLAIASTHSDVAPTQLRMMRDECYYNSQLYSKACSDLFSQCCQVQCSHSFGNWSLSFISPPLCQVL